MTVDLQPYPEYKDSGLLWFGKVPAHWEMPRLGHVLCERGETNVNGKIIQVLSVLRNRGVIPYEEKGNIGNKKSEDITRYKVVRPRDLVVNCMNVIIGSFGISGQLGCLSPVYYVLKTRKLDDLPEYFEAIFKIKPFQNSLVRIGNGILAHRMRIPMELLKCERLPRPPRPEQEAIVAFLRHFDAKVHRFIRNRRRLIGVLNEQKQAIINRAVTRGLDPNVTLKPSGIDWLGDIPTRWRAVRLKYVSRVQIGITLGKNYMGQQVEERPYLRVANVQTGRLDMRMVKTVAVPPSEIVRSELKPGDVLMTEGGDIDKLGRGCVWQGEIEGCLHQNHIFAVRVDQSLLLPDYLMALMASRLGRVYFQLTAKQTTNLASTNSSTLGAFPLVLPEVKEQRQILDVIGKKTLSLDAAIDRAHREIDLIREYRTRLIADVVTGKVDVRHLAPETVDAAPEDLDEGLYDEMPEDDEAELAEELTDADD